MRATFLKEIAHDQYCSNFQIVTLQLYEFVFDLVKLKFRNVEKRILVHTFPQFQLLCC